ncbi:hypothetical protein IWW47_004978, partial [Coemansia sp. RSA 2052]
VYALVGAASMLASTTRMTVTIVVIMFELTGALIYVLPIMLAVTVSKSVAEALDKDGYFEGIIHLNGYPFLSMDQEYMLQGTSDEIMIRASEMTVVYASGETLQRVMDILSNSSYSGFPVVKSASTMALAGYISRSDLSMVAERAVASSMYSESSPCCFARDAPLEHSDDMARHTVDFRPWVDPTPITISYNTDVNVVAETFRQLGVRYVLVAHHGSLLGIITKKDVVRTVRMQSRNNFGRPTLSSLLSCRTDRGQALWRSWRSPMPSPSLQNYQPPPQGLAIFSSESQVL